jgi:hypothetical protein
VVVSEHLGSGLEVLAEMGDEASAKSLLAVVEGGIAWLRGQAGAAATEGGPAPELVASGSELRLTLRQPAGRKLPASLAFLAATAGPAALRAETSANEARTIGDIRSLISAEATFSAESGGYYGEVRCLLEPKSCLPNSQAPSLLWLSADHWLGEAYGYRRRLFPGPAGPQPALLASYAYTATPVTPGVTGRRSFCGDSRGVVCADPAGRAIAAEGGECPAACQPVP